MVNIIRVKAFEAATRAAHAENPNPNPNQRTEQYKDIRQLYDGWIKINATGFNPAVDAYDQDEDIILERATRHSGWRNRNRTGFGERQYNFWVKHDSELFLYLKLALEEMEEHIHEARHAHHYKGVGWLIGHNTIDLSNIEGKKAKVETDKLNLPVYNRAFRFLESGNTWMVRVKTPEQEYIWDEDGFDGEYHPTGKTITKYEQHFRTTDTIKLLGTKKMDITTRPWEYMTDENGVEIEEVLERMNKQHMALFNTESGQRSSRWMTPDESEAAEEEWQHRRRVKDAEEELSGVAELKRVLKSTVDKIFG